MKLKLADTAVIISNAGGGSSFWRIAIEKELFHLERWQDNKWNLKQREENGYFKDVAIFTCRDPLKALNRGIKTALIESKAAE